MGILRKKKIKAYILLESLIALSVLVLIVTLVLGELTRHNKVIRAQESQEEQLTIAQMAVQTNQSQMKLNGVEVTVVESANSLDIYSGGKQLLHVQER